VFTGLIADVGRVRAVHAGADGSTLEVDTALAGELAEGDSVSVNGVCLTATRVAAQGFCAQAMRETLRSSALGALRAGSAVNLELALRADGRLGGHVVQGHVDGTGRVTELRDEGFSRVLQVTAIDPALLRYLVHKGAVAVDGVSLTVCALSSERFSVSLIPETLTRTTLGQAQVGDIVNLEVDVLAKHVERLLNAGDPVLDTEPV
jgi:riboflavin synthase